MRDHRQPGAHGGSNRHYGAHEELPVDLRHKAGALVFDLPPDADKKRIEVEEAKLRATFVEALKPYLGMSRDPVETFPKTPSTYSRAAYFQNGEILAQLGESDVDQLEFTYEDRSLSYIRLIPAKRLPAPIPLAQLREIVMYAPLLTHAPRGGTTDQNVYGAIAYEPVPKPGGVVELPASTQLFENGELWAISSKLVVQERTFGMPESVPIPLIPNSAFEHAYGDTLHKLLKFASERLQLYAPWTVELGVTKTNGVKIAMAQQEFWGPIRKPELVHRTALNAVNGDAVDKLLMDFFAMVYDASGYARPPGPIGRPGEPGN
ncbi:MAG: hypothetical protein M5U07_25960 [Xanthobacteraceae bacterium]|nr:hypothetical protein [Xanthobacteraceae bacterium]